MADVDSGNLIETTYQDTTAIVALNDLARMNTLHSDLREALYTQLQAVASDMSVRSVVLTGTSAFFSAGGDLSTMPPPSLEASRERMKRVSILLKFLATLDKPVVASVSGPAAGLAVSLICACDFVVANEDTRFLFPFSKLGLVPDGGIAYLLSSRLGASKARRILMSGSEIRGQEAAALGLVDELVPRDETLRSAVAVAEKIGAMAPRSISAIKHLFNTSIGDLQSSLDFEAETQTALYFSEDFREGKRAFFEHCRPTFTGQ